MGGTICPADCPKCGFEGAIAEYKCGSGEQWLLCVRCGYLDEIRIDTEKSELSGKLVWKREEKVGHGCFVCESKGKGAGWFGPVSEKCINGMKEDLDSLSIAKYSFQEKGKWFVKDLLSNETRPYPVDGSFYSPSRMSS